MTLHRSILTRIVLLVFLAALMPAAVLVGGSQYLNHRARLQMEHQAEETLDLAITLQQSLIDSRLTRMNDRAISLAALLRLVEALEAGTDLAPILEPAHRAMPLADLITVVDTHGVVRGRAGSEARGDLISYGGLVEHVIITSTPIATVERIDRMELTGEPGPAVAQVRLAILPTDGAEDPRVGSMLEDALALVGAAPILDEAGRVIGVVLVSDILNNDHKVVDEVKSRSPRGLPIDATLALDGIRVTTTVPAPGGGKRAVGTLYSDRVMNQLRANQEYRGRALVGGWQWQRTIYVPMTDHAGRVVGGSYVGIPEASFAALAHWTTGSTWLAITLAVLALLGPVIFAWRMAQGSIIRPLSRFTAVLTAGDLHTRVEAEETAEMRELAAALNGMTERIRQTVAQVSTVSQGVRAASDRLAQQARQTAASAEGALQVAAAALTAAEQVSEATERASGRVRELEVTLARIGAGTDEQARAIRHAGAVVAQVTGAVQDSRLVLADVLEATRSAVAAAQQGRHGALRTVAALDLAQMTAEAALEAADPEPGAARLVVELKRVRASTGEWETALKQIGQAADSANQRLWDLAAALNESGARTGAISQQMGDVSAVADRTAEDLRTTGAASREIIATVDGMGAGTESALVLVRQAQGHMTSIAESNRALLDLSERIRELAHELDHVTARFPQH